MSYEPRRAPLPVNVTASASDAGARVSIYSQGDNSNMPSQQRLERIELGKTGLLGGLNPGWSQAEVKSLERYSIKAGIQEALGKNIVPSIDALAVREIIPKLDFVDNLGSGIPLSEWRQPWSGMYTQTETSGSVTVYQTSTTRNYDRKVFVLYGARLVSTGPGRPAGYVESSVMELADSANNTYDLWQLQSLDTTNVLYTYAPLVYSKSVSMRIKMYPSSTSSGQFDTVKILGKVIEPLGDNVAGQRYSLFQ
jgi:hypothetical protein